MNRSMVLMVICLASPLAAQQRHTITHEDVFLMKRISAPAISPDGRWIVFSVTEPSYTEGDQVSDLWLVPSDGSAEPRRLTNTKGGESGVDWSPDSRRIAFSARREGDDQSQVYVLDLATGGSAARHESIDRRIESPVASRRQGDPVLEHDLSRRDDRLCQQRRGGGAQGAQVQRARV